MNHDIRTEYTANAALAAAVARANRGTARARESFEDSFHAEARANIAPPTPAPQPGPVYTVQLNNNGVPFWLRGSTWAFHADRADIFFTYEAANAALARAGRFMVRRLYARAVIVKNAA